MSQSNKDVDATYTISEDLSTKQFYFMKIGTSDNSALLNDTKGGNVLGILQDDPDNSNTTRGRIRNGAGSKIKLSGTVALGGEIISETDGTGIAKDAAAQHVVGVASQAGVTGDIIEMVFQHRDSHA